VLLRILDSLATHLKLRQADAHPQTITMLKSTFNALESVILGDAKNPERLRVAQKTLQQFKTLQGENAQRQATESAAKVATPGDVSTGASDPQVMAALAEIKEMIHKEFDHLRNEILEVINANAN
jgi:hypothetical protein